MYLFSTPSASYVPKTSSPDNRDAATRFDCYCDWLQATLQRDAYHPKHSGLPQAVAVIDADPDDAAPFDPIPDDPASEGDTLPCHGCGRPTRAVLLCPDCRERVSELADLDPCPWWIRSGWCTARVELFDGERVQVDCDGQLCRCEQPRCLDEVL